MQEILNLLFLTVVVLGTYSAALIIEGRKVCSKCGIAEKHSKRTHIPNL